MSNTAQLYSMRNKVDMGVAEMHEYKNVKYILFHTFNCISADEAGSKSEIATPFGSKFSSSPPSFFCGFFGGSFLDTSAGKNHNISFLYKPAHH